MALKTPTEVLFSTYHRRILGLLLLRPEQSFYVREIARLLDIPAGSLHRELKRLAESGLLLREPLGNQVRYRANRACPIYPELAELFRKTAGLAGLLREALAPLAERITAAFVFGSMARGGETETSDVDLFVIGEVDFAEVVAVLSPLRVRLGREVNPVVMDRTEFAAQRSGRERFVERVMTEPRLFLMGTDDDLG